MKNLGSYFDIGRKDEVLVTGLSKEEDEYRNGFNY